jgi:hypothetical protein
LTKTRNDDFGAGGAICLHKRIGVVAAPGSDSPAAATAISSTRSSLQRRRVAQASGSVSTATDVLSPVYDVEETGVLEQVNDLIPVSDPEQSSSGSERLISF